MNKHSFPLICKSWLSLWFHKTCRRQLWYGMLCLSRK